MLVGTNSDVSAAYNKRIVLEAVRRSKQVSRTEIAEQTNLTVQAVSTIVSQLTAEGWLLTHGRRSTSRGQPPLIYEVNPYAAYSIGLSTSHGAASAGIIDMSGALLAEVSRSLDTSDPDDTVSTWARLLRQLLNETSVPVDKILGTGVALAGTADATTGVIATVPNYPNWQDYPLGPRLHQATGLPATVVNDALAAAIAEHWFGEGGGRQRFLYVLFMEGVGGALIEGGQPLGGINGLTGRIGHLPVVPDGRRCRACGGQGCLNEYGSLWAAKTTLGLSDRELEQAFLAGRPDVHLWLDEASWHLATALLATENLFDPDAVIFGGLMPSVILRHLLDRLEELLPQRRMKLKAHHPPLLFAHHGSRAALIGAATLPLYQAVTPSMALVQAQLGRHNDSAHPTPAHSPSGGLA